MNIGEYEVRPAFKVGDRVRVRPDAPQEGRVGVVVRLVDQSIPGAWLDFPDGPYREHGFYLQELERLPPESDPPTAAQMDEAWECGVKAAEESHALGKMVLAAGKVALQAARPEFPYPTPSRVVIDSGAIDPRFDADRASSQDWYETKKAARDRHWQQKKEARESIESELRRTMTAWPMDARLTFFEQMPMPNRVTITARWERK